MKEGLYSTDSGHENSSMFPSEASLMQYNLQVMARSSVHVICALAWLQAADGGRSTASSSKAGEESRWCAGRVSLPPFAQGCVVPAGAPSLPLYNFVLR